MTYSNGIAHYYDFFATVWGKTDDAARFLIELMSRRAHAGPEFRFLNRGRIGRTADNIG